MALKQRYKLKLNSIEKIEELLQELYNECDRIVVEIQDEMNKLSNSVQLTDELVEAKAKYAKAMNDFIASKDKAIGKKLDIAKLMTEIHKHNGNVKLAVADNGMDWQSLQEQLYASTGEEEETEKKDEYRLNDGKR